ncbi:hypothetical protein ACP70R_004009 [Stipagrostis hirtigluma subsp. patula]
MEAQATTQPPSGSSAATYPRWVMFSSSGDALTDGSYSTADVTTLTGSTSTGHPISVSLHLAEPPAESRVRVHFPPGIEDRGYYGVVVAAHRDTVLIQIVFGTRRGFRRETTADYFVYNGGAATADPPRPPSLSLLPARGVNEHDRLQHRTPVRTPYALCKFCRKCMAEPTSPTSSWIMFMSAQWRSQE